MSELAARLDVPLGVYAPSTARHALVAVLQGWGYRDEEWLEAAALVTSELITNAVQHGGGCVEFTVESHDGWVVVSVADGSSVVPRRRDPDGIGGRGIAVVEALSTGWGVHDHEGGKRVWVALTAHPGITAAQTGTQGRQPSEDHSMPRRPRGRAAGTERRTRPGIRQCLPRQRPTGARL